MAEKIMKRGSTSPVIRKMHIKTTGDPTSHPLGRAINKKDSNNQELSDIAGANIK